METPHMEASDSTIGGELREIKTCNLCGSDRRHILHQWPPRHYAHDKFDTTSWDGGQEIELRVVQCGDCGLVYSCPSFRESALSLVYPKHIIEHDQFRNRSDLLDSSKWNAIIDCIDHVFAPGDKEGGRGVVCDIGARYGALVSKLAQAGFMSIGVEYNHAAVELAGRLGVRNLYQGSILEVPEICQALGIDRVNAFILDDVVEHLVDPKRDLGVLSRLQQPGDMLLLRQMDYDSLGRRLFRKNWYYFQPAAHMYYFSEKTLRQLLRALGYGIVAIRRVPWHRQLMPTVKALMRWFLVRLPVINRRFLRFRGMIGKGKERPTYLARRSHLSDMFMVVARKQ